MRFQLNDYVLVKPGVLLIETGEPVPGWVGQIVEVPTSPTDLFYLVELDAFSLEQLPEQYLTDCIINEETPTVYYFGEENLEHTDRRDTDEQRATAQARIEDLIFAPEEDDSLDEAQLMEWLAEFRESSFFAALKAEAQERALAIVEMYAEYAFNYRGDQPTEWTVETIREVCLELFPRKFTAEIEYFEQIGPVLSQFFDFLADTKYHQNAGALHREMQKIAPEMVRRAKDPRNWGMAKSIAMNAMAAGVDLNDENAMGGFMADYNANLFSKMDWDFPEAGTKKPQLLRAVRENPFKNISRNEVVKVKYPDGSIHEGKFKRMEDDLRAGKCELVR